MSTIYLEWLGTAGLSSRRLPLLKAVEDPWHNWYKPEEASEMEVAAVAQWQGQQHLQGALVSVVAAEPHHADLTLLEAQSRRGHGKLLREETMYQNIQQSLGE